MNNVDILTEQRRVLLETLKTIATDKRTPDWISNHCRDGAKKAKNLENDVNLKTEKPPQEINIPISIGDLVKNIDEKDQTIFEVLELSCEMDGIKLWDLRVMNGSMNGVIIHNIPSIKLKKI